MNHTAVRWGELPRAAQGLAAAVRGCFEAHPHHVLATVHRDGRPRVGGTNVMFSAGVLWIVATPGARRSGDLAADPRCALHSAPSDEDLRPEAPDARVEARARRLHREEASSLLAAAFGVDASVEGSIWELAVTSMSLVHQERGDMVVRSWSARTGLVETTLGQDPIPN